MPPTGLPSDTAGMTLLDYILNGALVGLVVLQLRGHRITRARLAFPVAVTVWVAAQFLHSIPTAGNDAVLEATLAVTGALLGVGAALTTSVRRDHAGAVARFSAVHHITTGAAWTAAFVLMAMAEVTARTGVLYLKTVQSGAEIPR